MRARGELLEALKAGGVEPLHDRAAGRGDPDALHPAVDLVLAALEVAPAQEAVDGAARARKRHVEPLRELLERHLAVACAQRVQCLYLRQREVELVEDRVQPGAGVRLLHQPVPEREHLLGELLGGHLRRRSSCLHVRKYCRCAR
jgi:hypothetical protein